MKKRNFVRKKIKSLTLGEKLKILRRDRRLRMQDLSRKINVKVAYIEALENGQYDNLPTQVYVKGFVKSYAQFFGVPENVLLDLFDREYGIYQNIYHKDIEEEVNKLPKVPRFVFTPRIIIAIVGFFVLSFVGLYLYFSVDNFVSSPWIVIDTPINGSTIHENKIIVQGKTKSNSKVFINEQQVFVDEDGAFESEVNLTKGINTINVRSINKFDKEDIEKIVVNSTYKVQKKSDIQEQKNIDLIIKSQNEPVWIHVIADDNDVYNDTLELNQEKKFKANDTVVITTSNGLDTLISDDGGETFKSISKKKEIVRNWKYKIDENKDEKNETYIEAKTKDNKENKKSKKNKK